MTLGINRRWNRVAIGLLVLSGTVISSCGGVAHSSGNRYRVFSHAEAALLIPGSTVLTSLESDGWYAMCGKEPEHQDGWRGPKRDTREDADRDFSEHERKYQTHTPFIVGPR